jgi:hypothetical protein
MAGSAGASEERDHPNDSDEGIALTRDRAKAAAP